MTPYTADASWLEPPRIPLQAWIDLIAQRNPEESGKIVGAYDTCGQMTGLNRDLALGQGCLETGFYTSDRWTRQRNPAGLGIESDVDEGTDFKSIDLGVLAHYQHIACYALDHDPPEIVPPNFPILDPHHTFHDNRPQVKDLIRPERKWAVPGTFYVADILRIVNSLIGDAPVTLTEPTQADIGFPVTINYTTAFPDAPKRALSDIQWFIVHDTEGGKSGSDSVLHGGTASVTALIDRDGSLEYEVPLDTTPYTAGNDAVSKLAVQVELVGFASKGYTEEQYRSCANFFKWCVNQGMTSVPAAYIGKVDSDGGPLPDMPGIIGHQDVPNPNTPFAWGGFAGHVDPGALFDWNRLVGYIGGSVVTPNGSGTYRVFQETGHGIDHGFKVWWESDNDPLYHYGFPVTEEFTYEGRTTQCFQRVVVQWFPEYKDTPYEFQTMLLGSEFAKLQGYSGPGIPK